MYKLIIAIILTLSIATSCQLVNVTVEPGVTQYYTAGFQIEFSNITSADWGKEIEMFVMRSEDNIPIVEILKNGDKYIIPDSGNYVTGFFDIGTKYLLDKDYVLWVQICDTNKTASFRVVNQYGIGDQVGNFIIWLKNNIFAIFIALIILALIAVILSPILRR